MGVVRGLRVSGVLRFQMLFVLSEAWGPPQFQEKRLRSEKAILGAPGEFRGIL